MSFVERVNQGESLVSGLNWLTEPPAVSWSVIMGHLSAIWEGEIWTHPNAFRTGPGSCAVHSMWLGHHCACRWPSTWRFQAISRHSDDYQILQTWCFNNIFGRQKKMLWLKVVSWIPIILPFWFKAVTKSAILLLSCMDNAPCCCYHEWILHHVVVIMHG